MINALKIKSTMRYLCGKKYYFFLQQINIKICINLIQAIYQDVVLKLRRKMKYALAAVF